MILFDYLYYLCCRFYRRNKDDQDLDTWRASGIILITVFIALVLMSIGFIGSILADIDLKEINVPLISIGFFVFSLAISIIRYNKFTSYKEIALKVEEYSPTKIWVLDIAVVIYIFLGAPLILILSFLRHNLGLI